MLIKYHTMKILTFGASNSRKSINKQFAVWAANQIKNANTNILDLNDFEMPIYSIDRENESGIPQQAREFKQKIKESDGILISLAEHNGAYTTAFKNIFDWITRIEKNPWDNKPMLLLATAPGIRGGKSVLEIAYARFKRMNDNEIFTFSLPEFGKNFSNEIGITNSELNLSFKSELDKFIKCITQ